jgi:DNA-binding transcriptional MocR family regulator
VTVFDIIICGTFQPGMQHVAQKSVNQKHSPVLVEVPTQSYASQFVKCTEFQVVHCSLDDLI